MGMLAITQSEIPTPLQTVIQEHITIHKTVLSLDLRGHTGTVTKLWAGYLILLFL